MGLAILLIMRYCFFGKEYSYSYTISRYKEYHYTKRGCPNF